MSRSTAFSLAHFLKASEAKTSFSMALHGGHQSEPEKLTTMALPDVFAAAWAAARSVCHFPPPAAWRVRGGDDTEGEGGDEGHAKARHKRVLQGYHDAVACRAGRFDRLVPDYTPKVGSSSPDG